MDNLKGLGPTTPVINPNATSDVAENQSKHLAGNLEKAQEVVDAVADAKIKSSVSGTVKEISKRIEYLQKISDAEYEDLIKKFNPETIEKDENKSSEIYKMFESITLDDQPCDLTFLDDSGRLFSAIPPDGKCSKEELIDFLQQMLQGFENYSEDMSQDTVNSAEQHVQEKYKELFSDDWFTNQNQERFKEKMKFVDVEVTCTYNNNNETRIENIKGKCNDLHNLMKDEVNQISSTQKQMEEIHHRSKFSNLNNVDESQSVNISLENANVIPYYSSEPAIIDIDQSKTAEDQSMNDSLVERRNSVVDNPETEPEEVHHDSQQTDTSPNYAGKLQRSSSMLDMSGASGNSAENLPITTRQQTFAEGAYPKKRLDDEFDYGEDPYILDEAYEKDPNRSDYESDYESDSESGYELDYKSGLEYDSNHLDLLDSEDEDDFPKLEFEKKNQEQTDQELAYQKLIEAEKKATTESLEQLTKRISELLNKDVSDIYNISGSILKQSEKNRRVPGKKIYKWWFNTQNKKPVKEHV